MTLTPDQKKALVSASISTVAFVLCDELLFRTQSRNKRGKTIHRDTWVAAGLSGAASFFLYDKASAETKADLEKYSIPAGAAAASFIAVNRFALPKIKPGIDARPYALGAAAVAAYFTNKETNPSTPTVGRLPERTFEPPFPPPFGPEFDPQYEG